MLPQTWSRQTGMIGAGLRLTICSKPRWNGSMKPVRVMPPSAKMQTTSPFCERLAGGAQRLDESPRPGRAVDGDDVGQAEKVAKAGHSRIRRPDHKANAPLLRRLHEKRVDVANVIAHQECRACGR